MHYLSPIATRASLRILFVAMVSCGLASDVVAQRLFQRAQPLRTPVQSAAERTQPVQSAAEERTQPLRALAPAQRTVSPSSQGTVDPITQQAIERLVRTRLDLQERIWVGIEAYRVALLQLHEEEMPLRGFLGNTPIEEAREVFRSASPSGIPGNLADAYSYWQEKIHPHELQRDQIAEEIEGLRASGILERLATESTAINNSRQRGARLDEAHQNRISQLIDEANKVKDSLSFGELAISGQPQLLDIDVLLRQIKTATEIWSDWRRAPGESVDVLRGSVQRLEEERANRAAEREAAVRAAAALAGEKEDVERTRIRLEGRMREIGTHPTDAGVRAMQSIGAELDAKRQRIANTATERELRNIVAALEDIERRMEREIEADRARQIAAQERRERDAADESLSELRTYLADKVMGFLRNQQLNQEAQRIRTEIIRLQGAQITISQKQEGHRLQRERLEGLMDRQEEINRQQAEAAAQAERARQDRLRQQEQERLERQRQQELAHAERLRRLAEERARQEAHQAWLNTPAGREYQWQREEQRRLEQIRRAQNQQEVLRGINNVLRNVRW